MKLPGWEGRVTAKLRALSGVAFQPGVQDCGLTFGELAKEITGSDPVEKLRGRYKTIIGAYRILRRWGFADHVDYVASFYEELPSPLHAQRGDGAAVRDDDGNPALGIVQGENIFVMRPDGLGTVRLTEAYRAFRL